MNVPVLLKARQTKYAAYATLYVVVVLAVLTVANVLGNRYNKTYDSTANKRYSLSEQTAKIVKGLKEPATIYYYDRPTGFKQAKDTLANLQFLWGRPVHLQTVVEGKPTTLSFDGNEHSSKTGGDADDAKRNAAGKTR